MRSLACILLLTMMLGAGMPALSAAALAPRPAVVRIYEPAPPPRRRRGRR